MVANSGIKAIKLPPRSPNLHAYAECFIRTIKESCRRESRMHALVLENHTQWKSSSDRKAGVAIITQETEELIVTALIARYGISPSVDGQNPGNP